MNIPLEKELLEKDELLSRKFNVSVKTIQRWKDKYGLRKVNKRLTNQEVEEIRKSKDTVKILAKKYNKTLAAIYRVKKNITYKTGIICKGSAHVDQFVLAPKPNHHQ